MKVVLIPSTTNRQSERQTSSQYMSNSKYPVIAIINIPLVVGVTIRSYAILQKLRWMRLNLASSFSFNLNLPFRDVLPGLLLQYIWRNDFTTRSMSCGIYDPCPLTLNYASLSCGFIHIACIVTLTFDRFNLGDSPFIRCYVTQRLHKFECFKSISNDGDLNVTVFVTYSVL